MTTLHVVLLIIVLGLANLVTRALPFVFFGGKSQPPENVAYLGRVLPPAMMGLLVVYSFKGYSLADAPLLFSAAVAGALTVAVHLWRRNFVVSIVVGTACYMVLMNR